MNDLVVALQDRALWYPVLGVCVSVALRVLPTVRVPRVWQWAVPVVTAALAAAGEALYSGEPWGLVALLALAGGLSAGSTAIGVYHSAKRVAGGGGASPTASAPKSSLASHILAAFVAEALERKERESTRPPAEQAIERTSIQAPPLLPGGAS